MSCHARQKLRITANNGKGKRKPAIKKWLLDNCCEVKIFGMNAEEPDAFRKTQEEGAATERTIHFSKLEKEKKAD